MTLVLDASAVVSGLTDSGRVGQWVLGLMATGSLAAPHLMVVEAANILRRSALSERISGDVAALAHEELLALPVEYFGYAPVAGRAWALRSNVTTYDAWFVALAEALEADLVTLDGRLSRAAGPRCAFRTPP